MYTSETTVRVRYGETDQMGYVYYGFYAMYYEVARVESLRRLGLTYKSLEAQGIIMPVLENKSKYIAPAYYDDELIVRTHITELRKRSLRFGYEIVRAENGQVVAEGETGHVITDSNGRVRSFPEGYAQRLLAPPLLKSHLSGEIVPSASAPE